MSANALQDSYVQPKSEVLNMDNRSGLSCIADQSFDLVSDDPPYFLGPEKREFYGEKVSSIGVKRLYTPTGDWQVPDASYFDEITRVGKYYVVWGCNYFDYKFHSGRIVWDKCNDSSDYSDCEIAATNLFDHVRIFRFMWNGMLQGSTEDGRKMQGNKSKNEKRIHPTQKPVQLYKWLFSRFAQPGWRILSPHVGSGSDRIAAHELGFDFTGYEIDPIHFNNQEERFQKHIKQLSLFRPTETKGNVPPPQLSLI
jgi:site-specific DNA-methyltransferase (adenine-specific)